MPSAPTRRPPPGTTAGHDLLRELSLLDERLEAAVAAMHEVHGLGAAADPLRGQYVSDDEAARLAVRPPGAPAEYAGTATGLGADDDGSRWAWLCRAAGLTELDAGILLIALAPEVDLKYERIYAYLQDDVTRRRPTVDLALGLLCAEWDERVAVRARLDVSAPLLSRGLLRLAGDPAQNDPPLLSRFLRPVARVVSFLLGSDEPDAAIMGLCTAIEPAARLEDVLLPDLMKYAPEAVVRDVDGGTTLVHLRGPYGVGKRTTAEAFCRAIDLPLLVVDVARLLAADDAAARVGDVAREALLRGAALLWEGFDLLLPDEPRAVRDAVLRAAEGRGVTFLAGEEAWEPADAPAGQGFYPVRLERPAYPDRVRLWRALLEGEGDAVDVEALANRFRFTGGQIRDAIDSARSLARVRAPADGRVSMDDLEAACRARSTPHLGALAEKVEPSHEWDDLVLPPDRTQQLREIAMTMRHRARVYHEWGFDGALSLGKGLNVLFTGPPGTGKTMAAGIIAGALGLDLYRIDLSMLVSKFIGETEKNLARVFTEAEASNAILFFDEADALFGRRGEVRDSHDRYANLEVAYLLQRMDEYEGVVILATNFRKNMDDAFARRMHHAVDFLLPGERERLRIWERVFPAATPRDPGLALDHLARRLEISGGSIRNIALSAAFLAADAGGVVRMEHLACAARRELQKLGKSVSKREIEDLALRG
jgi:ATP-dependent 26S proteasome regulatory subunit